MVFSVEPNLSMDDESLLDDDIDETEGPEAKTTPWLQSFAELKEMMVKIPDRDIYKRIVTEGNGDVLGNRTCRLKWIYSTFFEKEQNSYDSSYMPGTNARTSLSDEILPGIWYAIKTMRKGEESQFIIDHQLMYGKFGVVVGHVTVKPNANVLLVAKLVDFQEIGSETACEQLNDDELRKFRLVKVKVIEMQKKVHDFCRKNLYANAIRVNLDMIQRVLFTDVENEDEQSEKNAFLGEMYTKLSDCYVKVEDFKKAIAIIQDLRKIVDIDQDVDVLVNEAIAFGKIDDDYKRAITLLRKAQLLDPNNKRVNIELSAIQNSHDDYNAQTKRFMQRAFQTKPQTQVSQAKKVVDKIESTVTDVIKSFGNMDLGTDIPLVGYTDEELKNVEESIRFNPAYKLQTTTADDGQLKYSIKKLA